MVERRIKRKDYLLDDNGYLLDHGYSKTMLTEYNKDNIKKKGRIKEWDYYYVGDNRYGLCLTISNLSYVAVISASVIDFANKEHYDKTSMLFFPKNKDFMPTTSKDGVSELKTKDAYFKFEVKKGKRILSGYYENFYDNLVNNKLSFEIEILNEPKESMVKVTPFKNKNHFYYNQKINCMAAQGFFTFQGRRYYYDKQSAMATLDWGRGVLPYNSLWYWASMQGTLDNGDKIGFNFGKALGDNTQATENMIFYNGKAHKVSTTAINIQRDGRERNYMGTWTFYSDDGKVELTFEPIVDRYVPFNVVFIKFIPHQVFGKYSGTLTLDDGTKIQIKNMLGFAERVVNRW